MTYKILIHSLPATGHMNPMAVVVERLVSEYKCHCIWYSFEELRDEIRINYAFLKYSTHKDDKQNFIFIKTYFNNSNFLFRA